MFVLVGLLVGALGERRTRAKEARSRLAAPVEYSNNAIIGKTLDALITSWNIQLENRHLMLAMVGEADGTLVHNLTPVNVF